MRRAGHVGHQSAGPDEPDSRGEQLTLQRHQVGHIGRRSPPPGLWPPAQGPESRTGGVEQHPVEADHRRRPGCTVHQLVHRALLDTAFAQMNVGLASAMSVILVLVVGVITFIQFHYLQGDGD